MLSDKGQTAVPLQQHKPRTVLSCPTDWIPYAMKIPYKVPSIDASDTAYPNQTEVLLVYVRGKLEVWKNLKKLLYFKNSIMYKIS